MTWQAQGQRKCPNPRIQPYRGAAYVRVYISPDIEIADRLCCLNLADSVGTLFDKE